MEMLGKIRRIQQGVEIGLQNRKIQRKSNQIKHDSCNLTTLAHPYTSRAYFVVSCAALACTEMHGGFVLQNLRYI